MLTVTPGGEYRGEVYISCDSHPTAGWNNGQGRGAIFDGDTSIDLLEFIADHGFCPDGA